MHIYPSVATTSVTFSDQFAQARQYLAKAIPWPAEGEPGYVNIMHTFVPENLEPGRKPWWSGRACKTVDEAINAIDFALKGKNTRDVFACLSLQRECQEKVSKKGFKYKAAIRNQENALGLKSLFLDIDVGSEDGKYASVEEAKTALVAFLKVSGLPRPSMIVSSGGGLHCYWSVNRALTLEEWQPLAYALVEATKRHGLKCDRGCTTDAARVLRPPATLNRKTDPPRPVSFLVPPLDFDYSVECIRQALLPYAVPVSHVNGFTVDANLFKPRPLPAGDWDDASAGLETKMPQADMRACLDAIPNNKVSWLWWNTIGMRIYAACQGEDYGLEEWQRWSDTNPVSRTADSCAERWNTYGTSPPTRTGAGALVNEARAALGDPGWMPPPLTAGTTQQTAATTVADPVSFADPWADFVGPEFPLDVLPPTLANFVEAQHRAMGADPAALAMSSLVAVGGALHAETKAQVGDGWPERPNLWVALIGAPSTMKSPILAKVTAPLRQLDHERDLLWRQQETAWQQKKNANQSPGPRPPKPARSITQDATPEKLAEILSRDPRGSLMVHDELAGLLAGFERYNSGAPARAFYLTCWNGGPYLKDRVGQGIRDNAAEIRIDNLALSMLGGIQPDRLAAIRDLTSDGFLQRLLPVLMRSAERGDESHPVSVAEAEYEKLLRAINAVAPQVFVFDSAATCIKTRVLDWLFDLEQIDGFPAALIGAIGKLKGYYGRIALVLHVAAEYDSIVRGQTSTPNTVISCQTAEAAERVIKDFLLPNVFGLYDVIANNGKDREMVQAVAGFILATDKDRLRPSDFTAGVRGLRGEPSQKIVEWAGRFCALGWLAPEFDVAVPKAWLVVPGLRAHFAERCKQVKAARAAAHAILRAGRQEGKSGSL